MVEHPGELGGERFSVPLGREKSRRSVFDQFGNARMIGADRNQACGHRLHEGNRNTFHVAVARGHTWQQE